MSSIASRTWSLFSEALAGLLLATVSTACGSPAAPSPNRLQTAAAPVPAPKDLAGPYTLTLSASSRCPADLPADMRNRTYAATIAQTGGSLTVTLPSIFPPWGNRAFGTDNRFTGVLGANNDVIFQFQFEEWFAQGQVTDFWANGTMTATTSPSGLSGSWDGTLRGVVDNPGGHGNHIVTCSAPDHGVVFSR